MPSTQAGFTRPESPTQTWPAIAHCWPPQCPFIGRSQLWPHGNDGHQTGVPGAAQYGRSARLSAGGTRLIDERTLANGGCFRLPEHTFGGGRRCRGLRSGVQSMQGASANRCDWRAAHLCNRFDHHVGAEVSAAGRSARSRARSRAKRRSISTPLANLGVGVQPTAVGWRSMFPRLRWSLAQSTAENKQDSSEQDPRLSVHREPFLALHVCRSVWRWSE